VYSVDCQKHMVEVGQGVAKGSLHCSLIIVVAIVVADDFSTCIDDVHVVVVVGDVGHGDVVAALTPSDDVAFPYNSVHDKEKVSMMTGLLRHAAEMPNAAELQRQQLLML